MRKLTMREVMERDLDLQALSSYEVAGGLMDTTAGSEEACLGFEITVALKFNYYKGLIQKGEISFEEIEQDILNKYGCMGKEAVEPTAENILDDMFDDGFADGACDKVLTLQEEFVALNEKAIDLTNRAAKISFMTGESIESILGMPNVMTDPIEGDYICPEQDFDEYLDSQIPSDLREDLSLQDEAKPEVESNDIPVSKGKKKGKNFKSKGKGGKS